MLLVALWAGAATPGMKFEPQEDGSRILRNIGHGPVSIDSLEGFLAAPAGVSVYPLGPDGSRGGALPGGNTFRFYGNGTMFFELTREVEP